MKADLALTYPVLSDPERRWYRAFNVPRGSWPTVLAPRILRQYARALLAGKLRLPREDLRQLGAGVLLRGDQAVRAWVTDESERRPPIDEVLAAARQ